MERLKLLLTRPFLLVASGEAASLVGDQFTRIAAIWLVLEMTESAAAVGLWIALAAVPRAAFMLIGGALIDRFDPRSVMMVSNGSRLSLVTVLTIAAASESLTMTGLYVFAILFGTAGALYAPAISVLVPRVLSVKVLQTGNSVIQGLLHVANLIGPPLAALMLAVLLREIGAAPQGGVTQKPYAALFAIDAATFLVSLWTLFRIGPLAKPETAQPDGNMLNQIVDGLRFVAVKRNLRTIILIAVVANLGLGGPLAVGLPLLAKFALPQGVVALGVLSAAASAGSLVGLAAAALLRQHEPERLFAMPLIFLPVLGILMISLGWTESLERAAASIGLMTALALYLDIQVLTWLQQTTEPQYLGRVMSILQFGALGLTPVSMALAGFMGANLPVMFAGFGGFVVVAAAALALLRRKAPRAG